jgi:hypothetical protein
LVLPTTLPCGARTFLGRGFAAVPAVARPARRMVILLGTEAVERKLGE